MRFYIIFCTNVMSGLTLLCADLRFGLSPAFSPLQSPICHSCSLLLDFLLPPLRFKVQSATLARSFWTSSHLPATSKSNPQLLLAPFGLPRISPPLQSPICHSCSLLLDFLLPPSASKSNLPLLLAPPRKKGGLQRNPPILIRQSHSGNSNQPA